METVAQNLILLDEPTNGLDEQSVGVFLEEMRRQREQGKTVIIASHHRDELNLIADQFHSMASVRLHAAGPMDAHLKPLGYSVPPTGQL